MSLPVKEPLPIAGFNQRERDYIRRELDMFFSTLPAVAEGFQLKIWRKVRKPASRSSRQWLKGF